MSAPQLSRDGGPPPYETRDVHMRPLVVGLVGLIGLLAGVLLLMLVFTREAGRREAARSPRPSEMARTYGRQQPPDPRLQRDPVGDLARLRAEQEEALSTYGWANRERGEVRIPIEQAMKKVLDRGFAPWPKKIEAPEDIQ